MERKFGNRICWEHDQNLRVGALWGKGDTMFAQNFQKSALSSDFMGKYPFFNKFEDIY